MKAFFTFRIGRKFLINLILLCVATTPSAATEGCPQWMENNETHQPDMIEYTYRTGDPIPTETKPVFDMVITPGTSVQPGEVITFDLSASRAQHDGTYGGQEIVTWIHDFGDGTQFNGPIAQHTYEEPGVYRYTNKIHDDTGWRWGAKAWVVVGDPPCGPPAEEIWVSSGDNLMHGWLKLPAGEGPWPVILEYGPYPATGISNCDHFARNGYAHAKISAPGRSLSTGEFDLFGQQTRQGGYDAVEWLAAQPWCDGNVGMIGASGPAVAALLTASANPPALKCVMARSSYADLYRDLIVPGGVMNADVFTSTWIPLLSATDATAGEVTDEEGNLRPEYMETLEDNLGLLAEIKLHPFFDDFWRERAIVNYPLPEAPVLFVGNQRDYWPRSLVEIQRWIAPSGGRVVSVTGGHVHPELTGWYPGTGAELLAGESLAWFDHYLKGDDTVVDTLPPIMTLSTYGGDIASVFNFMRWEQLEGFPSEEHEVKQYFLRFASANPDRPNYHSLSPERPEILEPPTVLNWAPTQGVLAGFTPGYSPKSHVTALQESWELTSLVFETPVLQKELPVNGPATLTFYATPANPVDDMSFAVHINDVWPDGTSHFIQQGHLLASHRALDEDKSLYVGEILVRPYHPHTDEAALGWEAGTIYRFDVEIWGIHNVFRPGHRLRLALAAQDLGFRTNFETDVAAIIFSDFYKPSTLNLLTLPSERSTNPFPIGVSKDDIAIDSVRVAPTDLATGDLATATATVANVGEWPLGEVSVAFYDGDPANGGIWIGQASLASLDIGQSAEVSVEWRLTEAGWRSIHAVADPNNLHEEVCKQNNHASTDVFVKLRTFIDDTDPAVEYVGGWHRKNDAGALDGTYTWRFSNGQRLRTARLAFSGHAVTLYYGKSSRGGEANVYIDGEYRMTLDFYRSGDKRPDFGHALVIKNLVEGEHEIVVVHAGRGVYLDGFEILSGDPASGGADPSMAQSSVRTQEIHGTLGGALNPTLTASVEMGELDEEISVIVEGPDHPVLVQILDPLGTVLASGETLVNDVLDISGVERGDLSPGTYTIIANDPLGVATPTTISVSINHLYP